MAGPLTAIHNTPARRLALALLTVAVVVVHGVVSCSVAESIATFGQAEAMPPRLQAVFVSELRPTAAAPEAAVTPAPVLGAARTPRSRRPVARPARAASQAEAAASAAEESALAMAEAASTPAAPPVDEPAPPTPPAPPGEVAGTPLAAASAASAAEALPPRDAAVAPAEAASAPTAFEWPPATRLSYRMLGYYRGELHGSAEVEWLRDGDRYQVHLEVIAGAPFAPLFSRNMTSSGRITADGLYPERYDEVTKRLFSASRQVRMQFDATEVALANGQRLQRLPGVQDTASQFVQLTWLFTTHREPLRVGSQLVMPLALPRSMHRWIFDVVAEEILSTPFGPVASFHVQPRRDVPGSGELSAEIWFAPALQYLPVRFRIRQDAETYIDLSLERLPQQALR